MERILLKKITALFVAVVFSFTSLTANAAVTTVAASSDLADASFNFLSVIPMSQGKITNFNNEQSDTVVINIQDLHSHADTQRNILKIIGSLTSKYDVSGIYTEGGFGNIDVSWINVVKNAELKNKIIEQLLNDGDLTASEYYAMTAENPLPVKGIEDKQIHRENINRLAEMGNNKARYEAVIAKIDKEIAILNKLYTNNRNIRFNRTLARYDSLKMADLKLYRMLEKYVDAINANPERYNNITKITFDNYPNIKFYLSMMKESDKIDNKAASAELQSLVGTLKNTLSYAQYKQIIESTDSFNDSEKVIEFVSLFFKENPEAALKFKNLNKLSRINEFARLLNPVNLLSEQRLLIEKIKFALSYDNTEAEISFITDFKKYFKDYLANSLTQDDWIYVKENLQLFLSLYAKYAAHNNLKEIEADLEELTKYYDVNTNRNEIFLSNIFDKADAFSSSGSGNGTAEDVLKNAKDIKIVITGGYHSEGLKELLSQKGITSLVITPNVTTDVSQARVKYEEIIKEQSRFPMEALAYLLLSNTGNVNQQVKVLQAANALGLDIQAIENLAAEAGFRLLDGNILINGETFPLILEDQARIEVSKIESAISPLLQFKNLFQNPKAVLSAAEKTVLMTIGELLLGSELGEIAEIQEAGLSERTLAGVEPSNYSRYPKFIQKILLNKELRKMKSVFMVSQQELNDRMDKYNPDVYVYRKVPTFGIQIPKFNSQDDAWAWLSSLDEKFNRKLIDAIGSVDGMEWFGYVLNNEKNKAEYERLKTAIQSAKESGDSALLEKSAAEFAKFQKAGLIDQILNNAGGIIALQDKTNADGTGELDCYVIDLQGMARYTRDGKLITLAPDEVNGRNIDENGMILQERLSSLFGVNDLTSIDGLVGIHKQADEAMVRAEDLKLEVSIVTSDGKTQKIVGGWFVLDKKGYPKYVVNGNGKGNPVLYESVGEAKTDILEFANAGISASDAEVDSFLESNMTVNSVTLPLLRTLIKRFNPKASEYAKQAPIYGYSIPSDLSTKAEIESFRRSMPEQLLSKLGSVDNTAYLSFVDPWTELTDAEYAEINRMFSITKAEILAVKAQMTAKDADKAKIIAENKDFFDAGLLYQFYRDRGSVIALQMNGSQLDAYIVGTRIYNRDYQNVPIDDVEDYYADATGNSLREQVENQIGEQLNMSSGNILGLKKKLKATVTMFPATKIGINPTVASSASQSGQKINAETFIAVTKAEKDGKVDWEYYIVQSEEGSSNPIFYELVEVKTPAASETAEAAETETEAEKISRILFGYDAATADKILDEIKSNRGIGESLVNAEIINTVASVEGHIRATVAMDGNINIQYKLSASPLNPEKMSVVYTGLIGYLESNGRDIKMISTTEDISILPEYFRNVLDYLIKEGAYNLWKKGEIIPSDEDLQYFVQLEADAKTIYEAKKVKIEELRELWSQLRFADLDASQRKKFDAAAIFWSNAFKVHSEYYKNPSNPAFGELLTVRILENEALTNLGTLERHIKELKNIQYGALTSDVILNKWYSKLLIKLFGRTGLRIVQVAIAPFAELFMKDTAGKQAGLMAMFRAFNSEDHAAANEIQQRFEAVHSEDISDGVDELMRHVENAYNRVFSVFAISWLANFAAMITLIVFHAKWNIEHPDRAMTSDSDGRIDFGREDNKKALSDLFGKLISDSRSANKILNRVTVAGHDVFVSAVTNSEFVHIKMKLPNHKYGVEIIINSDGTITLQSHARGTAEQHALGRNVRTKEDMERFLQSFFGEDSKLMADGIIEIIADLIDESKGLFATGAQIGENVDIEALKDLIKNADIGMLENIRPVIEAIKDDTAKNELLGALQAAIVQKTIYIRNIDEQESLRSAKIDEAPAEKSFDVDAKNRQEPVKLTVNKLADGAVRLSLDSDEIEPDQINLSDEQMHEILAMAGIEKYIIDPEVESRGETNKTADFYNDVEVLQDLFDSADKLNVRIIAKVENFYGRDIVEVEYSDGVKSQKFLFYKSFKGTGGLKKAGSWYPLIGIQMGWFVKYSGVDRFYDRDFFEIVANRLKNLDDVRVFDSFEISKSDLDRSQDFGYADNKEALGNIVRKIISEESDGATITVAGHRVVAMPAQKSIFIMIESVGIVSINEEGSVDIINTKREKARVENENDIKKFLGDVFSDELVNIFTSEITDVISDLISESRKNSSQSGNDYDFAVDQSDESVDVESLKNMIKNADLDTLEKMKDYLETTEYSFHAKELSAVLFAALAQKTHYDQNIDEYLADKSGADINVEDYKNFIASADYNTLQKLIPIIRGIEDSGLRDELSVALSDAIIKATISPLDRIKMSYSDQPVSKIHSADALRKLDDAKSHLNIDPEFSKQESVNGVEMFEADRNQPVKNINYDDFMIKNHDDALAQLEAFENASNIGKDPAEGGRQKGLYVDASLGGNVKEVITVGDIHGRLDNIVEIVEANREKLESGEAMLVFLGDMIHSETDLSEMKSSIATMQYYMWLKIAYPTAVYMLAGNHDVGEDAGKGSVKQGELYFKNLKDVYSEEYAEIYSKITGGSFAIVAEGDEFIATHAGPVRGMSLSEVEDYFSNAEIGESLFTESKIYDATWGRMRGPGNSRGYTMNDVAKFAGNKVLIVGHTKYGKDKQAWHWDLTEYNAKHMVIFGARNNFGYARITEGMSQSATVDRDEVSSIDPTKPFSGNISDYLNFMSSEDGGASLTLPWWFLPVSLPRIIITGTALLLYAPVRFITGKSIDSQKLKATVTSIVEIPWTILLPTKLFVLLHYSKNNRETVKRYLYGHDAAEKSEILLNNARLIDSVEKRLEGTEKIKKETLKWLIIGIPVMFFAFFFIEYTDRHLITTRPFGDLLGMSDWGAAKIVFKSILDNEALRSAIIAGASLTASIANAVTHWKHNLNPLNIKAKATLDLSEDQSVSKAQSIYYELADAMFYYSGDEEGNTIPHYDELSETTDELLTEMKKLKDGLDFTERYYSATINPAQARPFKEGLAAIYPKVRSALFRTIKAELSPEYYGKLNFLLKLYNEGILDWQTSAWLLIDHAESGLFDRLDVLEKNINVADVFSKIPKTLLFISSLKNIDIEKINSGYFELLQELEPFVERLLSFGIYAESDILETLAEVSRQGGKITPSVFSLILLGFDYEQIKEMQYKTITGDLSIVFDSGISEENPINAILGDMFVTGRFLTIDKNKKFDDVFGSIKDRSKREMDKKTLTDNALAVMDFYSFFDCRMKKELVDGRSLDGSVVFGIEKFQGRERNLVSSPANFWPEYFGMQNWHDLVDEFGYGKEIWSYRRYIELLPEIMRKIEDRGQPVVFMLPSDFDYTKDGFTASEFRFLLENPEKMKNVIFVVGAYDFFDITSSVEEVSSYLSMNFLSELLKDHDRYIGSKTAEKTAERKNVSQNFIDMLNTFKEKLNSYLILKDPVEAPASHENAVNFIQAKLNALAEGNNLGIKSEDLENVKNANISLSLQQLEALYSIASEHHAGQTRKDGQTPYIAHVLGTAAILIQNGITNAEIIAAAFLHDTLEDSVYYKDSRSIDWVKTKISEDLFAAGFTRIQVDEIMSYVMAITKQGKPAYDYYSGLIAKGSLAVALKVADRTNNLLDLDNDPEMASKYLFGKGAKTETLQDFLTQLYGEGDAAATLLDMLEDTDENRSLKDAFVDAFFGAINKNILYTFIQFIRLNLGFHPSTFSGVAGTAYVVYTTSKNLDADIEKYGSASGAIFIVNDIVGDDYIGKVNGVPVRRVNNENKELMVFSANGVTHDEILIGLQGNRALGNVSNFIVEDKENRERISFEGNIIKAGIDLIENQLDGLNDYAAELTKIHRQWRNAQADKNILDMAHLNAESDAAMIDSVIKTLLKQTTYQQTRVMLNRAQMESLTSKRSLKDLQLLGVEVFLSVDSINEEQLAYYTGQRVSGIFVNDALIDLNTGKQMKIRTFLTKEDLNGQKLDSVLSDNYQGFNIIGLNLIKEEINNTRNILQNNNILAAVFGWFEKTFVLSEITEQDAINMAQQLEFKDELILSGELTENEARKAAERLPEAQIMLKQLNGDAKAAYEKTIIANIIALNMMERGRAERNIEKGKMIIENDNGMRNTLIALITKAVDLDQNFNGNDYLHIVSIEIDTELTFGAIIARALEELPGNAGDEQKKKKLEQIKEAIAVVVNDAFNPVFNLTVDKKKEAEKAVQIRLGTRAMLAAA